MSIKSALLLAAVLAVSSHAEQDAADKIMQARCGLCTKIADRIIEQAETKPLGQLVSGHKPMKDAKRLEATLEARAEEIVDDACLNQEVAVRSLCDEVKGRFEEKFVRLVRFHEKKGKAAAKERSEKICKPVCKWQTDMQDQIKGMQEQMKKSIGDRPVLDQIRDVIETYWFHYLCLFAGLLAVSIGGQVWWFMRGIRKAREEATKQQSKKTQ